MKQKIIFITSIIGSLVTGALITIVVYHYFPMATQTVEKKVQEVSITETNTIKSAINKVYDAVVVVESYKGSRLYSSGTGFIYKKDDKTAYIATNHHVIEGATSVKITNNDGQTVEAKVLGSDQYADIAVLSIDAKAALAVASMGDSTKLELGDTLFTVGTPVGKEYIGTVTRGILSGKNRTVSVSLSNGGNFMMEVIQTDAAINPGNSGGPLVNINGEVIGMNSMKLVEDEIEGMGFAIPIEIVMASVDRLEKGEQIKHPYLGAELLDVDNTYGLYMRDIYLDDSITAGAVVAGVTEGDPAAKAGLKKGDVILEIDGTKVQNSGHLRFVLYKYEIGTKIKVKVYRDKKVQEIEVTLSKSVEDNQ